MLSGSASLTKQRRQLLTAALVLPLLVGAVWAQVGGSIKGTVKDTSGSIVPDAAITVKNLETGSSRTANTDTGGSYNMAALPVGRYEVTAEKPGFKQAVRQGVELVVAQQLVLDLTLEVGAVEQQVTVTAAAPLVNTTLSSISGLVSEQQVKELPLNGRSFDQLLTLNVGVGNYSSMASRNQFSVSGRRPDENRFMINGIDLIGVSNGLTSSPTGASGQLLGVEAVREFNVLTETYGADYGKKSGGQVNIITQSGTNQLHGSAFEYLRNSALDARNFFDVTKAPPPFRRNQFGGALGGPVIKDKLFLFGTYEGFRQQLGGSGQNVVPDLNARKGFLPIGPDNSLIQVPDLKPAMLEYMKLWREPNGQNLGAGTALAIYNPVNGIREDQGMLRFDYNVSPNDSLSGNYMVDDGKTNSISSSVNTIGYSVYQNKVVSLQENRIFSPTLLNVLTLGYTRAYTQAGATRTVPIPDNLRFATDTDVGSITIGGSIVTGGTTIARANGGGRKTWMAKNLYTVSDSVNYTQGRHAFGFGVWVQRNQLNTGSPPTSGDGAIQYSTLTTMLQDSPTVFQGVASVAPFGYRTTLASWYVQDDIKLTQKLNLRLGLRHEMTSGFNEAHCRAANYGFDANGTILTEPFVGCSALTQNNAQFLFQPRVALAWDPTGTGSWSVRAGFSITHDLQDDLLHRLWHPPLNGVISIRNTPLLSIVPIPGGTLSPPTCNFERVSKNQPCSIYSVGVIEPTFKTPTIQQWSFTIERQLATNLVLRVGYVGSEDFHMPTSEDMNIPIPQRCANPAGCIGGGIGTARGLVPQGKEYLPPATVSATTSGLANPYVGNTFSWFFGGTSSYHGLDLSLVKRMSSGLSFKANYSFSKAIDQMSAVVTSIGSNEPQILWNRYNTRLNKGVTAFNLRHQFSANFSYELPFGKDKALGSGATGIWEKLISGWQWNGIVQAQGGFPTTPQVGSNISGSGDTRTPDVPDRNPNFTGPVIIGTVAQWYDPRAFLLPIPGTFGDAGRGVLRGPRLFNMDTSLFKKIPLSERFNLNFRFEAFNILNHTSLGNPSPIVFSGNNYAPAAGRITNTATMSRQLQFALRLTF